MPLKQNRMNITWLKNSNWQKTEELNLGKPRKHGASDRVVGLNPVPRDYISALNHLATLPPNEISECAIDLRFTDCLAYLSIRIVKRFPTPEPSQNEKKYHQDDNHGHWAHGGQNNCQRARRTFACVGTLLACTLLACNLLNCTLFACLCRKFKTGRM